MKRKIQSLQEGLPLFKALSSQTRINILELLMKKGPMNMTAIAKDISVTGGAITTHVKLLHEAGLINIDQRGGKHGLLKICSANVEPFTVDISVA